MSSVKSCSLFVLSWISLERRREESGLHREAKGLAFIGPWYRGFFLSYIDIFKPLRGAQFPISVS